MRILTSITEKIEIFLAYPASAKFALSRRLYNLITLATPILRSKRVRCNICGWKGFRFKAIAGVTYIRYNAICPGCGSLERQRALVEYLNKKGNLSQKKCLDIGSSSCLRAYFEAKDCNYISIDLDSDSAMIKTDATRLSFVNSTFDLVICSHVLEHIKDDVQAIKEIFRVLTNGGTCYVLVPFNKNRTNTIEYEKPNPLDPVHVRSYGLDILDRIKSTGFTVENINLVSESSKNDINHYRLDTEEICFLCTKN